MNSLDFVAKQTDFNYRLQEERGNYFLNWKALPYDCLIPAKDDNGEEIEAAFSITHLFYLREVYGAEPDEEAKKAKSMVMSIYDGTAKHSDFAYFFSSIISLIFRLKGKPVVLFAQEPVAVWEKVGNDYISMTDKYLLRFAESLKRVGIKYIKWDEAEKIANLDATHLIIVDLASDEECLDIIFQKVFEYFPTSKPSLAYFSLVKQCTEDEMKELKKHEDYRKEAQENKKLLEEEKRRKAAEKKEKEAQELKRKQEAEERQRREAQEAEERRLEEERKEAEERQRKEAEEREKKALETLTSAIQERKADADKILQILKEQGIEYLYHFTDVANLQSIKKQKGLFSREYCRTHNIIIPKPGGGDLSADLDNRYNLQDYVRLCFIKDHPMAWDLQKHRIVLNRKLQRFERYNLVWLKIKIDVALAKETLFSDMNATKTGHHHGGSFADFQMIDFEAVKALHPKKDSPLYSKHQAEVLVKTFIPIEYILNIDNPEPYTV